MKKIAVLKVITFLASLVFVFCSPISMAKTSSSESIRQVINQYEGYLNAGDTHSIMKLYGKNPIFMPQHLPAQVGYSAVKKTYDAVFTMIDLDIKFTIYEIEINKNTAWARTSSAGSTRVLATGEKVNEGNNELFVLNKENGEWKIHRYLFSTSTPRH